MHFLINQGSIAEFNVNPVVVNKIYDLVYKDNIDNTFLNETSDFKGNIYTSISYHEYIDYINQYYPDFHVTADNYYILFADKEVERILINSYCPEAVGITATLQVNQPFNNVFINNTTIQSFNELKQLTNIKTLANSSFKGCTNLKSITLDNITQIGEQVFNGCTSLSIDVYLPNALTIKVSAFRNTAIKSILNLGSTDILWDGAFYGCTNLTTIAEYALDNITQFKSNVFYGCTNLQRIDNCSNTTIIGQNAWNNCSSLEYFDFSGPITSIGGWAFNNCTSLVIDDLNLPSLSELGGYAFLKTKLKKISNLGTITTINANTFNNCKDLTEITNDSLNNVTKILSNAFSGCSKLSSIGKTENLTEIGSEPFSNCSVLTSIDLHNVTKIDHGAFSGCSLIQIKDNDLTSIQYIGYDAFRNCNSLSGNIDLGSNIVFMSDRIFYGCNCNIIIRNTEMIPLTNSTSTGAHENSFNDLNGKIYVLDNLVNQYKETYTSHANKFYPLSNIES